MTAVPQMRPGPGEENDAPWYSPARDITVLAPDLVMAALRQFDGNEDTPYVNWLRAATLEHVSDEDIMKVAEALSSFMSEENLIGSKSLDDAFESSGMDDLRPSAEMLVMALIGQQALAAYWWGIRGATVAKPGESHKIKQNDPKEFQAEAQEVVDVLQKRMGRSKWSLWLGRTLRKLRQVIGKEHSQPPTA